ncbi:UL16-binding protein 1-like [Phyllostomus hastatus]|uniref:UL16-binding protein 1-like n=1 Tax=Phyllostomus hastatus TaxID=9423 RepID=UPI001E6848D8|nr:UL16-binding protein 1-like [Phyllostomus hastatus]
MARRGPSATLLQLRGEAPAQSARDSVREKSSPSRGLFRSAGRLCTRSEGDTEQAHSQPRRSQSPGAWGGVTGASPLLCGPVGEKAFRTDISRPCGAELQLLLTVEGMASCIFRLAVFFLAVLSYGSGALGDAHSLCSVLSVSASGPPWCEFLGTIHETPFFKYSCKSRMAEPVGPVGMMLNATEAWNQQCEHWTELFPELQNALLDNQKTIGEAFGRDSLALQGSMMCEQESNGCPKTFWEFGFKGQMCLHFDSKNRRWAELHPGCSSLKDTLDKNSDISRRLDWISNGNCVKLLNQSTVLNTKAAPIMATTTAPAPAPAPAPSKAVIVKDNIALVLTPICILLTLGI